MGRLGKHSTMVLEMETKNILGRGILDLKVNLERRKASFCWKGTFQSKDTLFVPLRKLKLPPVVKNMSI